MMSGMERNQTGGLKRGNSPLGHDNPTEKSESAVQREQPISEFAKAKESANVPDTQAQRWPDDVRNGEGEA